MNETSAVRDKGAVLHPYMAYEGCEPCDGAALVFARNAKEAKRLAWNEVEWFNRESWLDLKCNRLRGDADHLGNAALLAAGQPHVISAPRVCATCELWKDEAYDTEGRCESCVEDAEWKAERHPAHVSALEATGEAT